MNEPAVADVDAFRGGGTEQYDVYRGAVVICWVVYVFQRYLSHFLIDFAVYLCVHDLVGRCFAHPRLETTPLELRAGTALAAKLSKFENSVLDKVGEHNLHLAVVGFNLGFEGFELGRNNLPLEIYAV